MDALTAIAIVTLVGAVALAAAALLTAGSRIGVLPARPGQEGFPSWAGLSENAKQSRVFGWILVLLYYLAAVFCLLQGINAMIVKHRWAVWQATFGDALSAPGEMALYSRFWFAIAVALALIGSWALWRLRRRAA
ncbi:MAG TPA: hypothetical protein VHX43_19675 [Xanthobacteraceae bacterium]|jgi:hypothetical protein|nr:hypothetical protein [Xanthobacteraceae bacterium]